MSEPLQGTFLIRSLHHGNEYSTHQTNKRQGGILELGYSTVGSQQKQDHNGNIVSKINQPEKDSLA